MKKILLFGATGMLGNYIQRVLSKHYIIEASPRVYGKPNSYTGDVSTLSSIDVETRFYVNSNTVIINAAGIIPQRSYWGASAYLSSTADMIKVNALWPHTLAKIKLRTGCEVINITTDCVFEGWAPKPTYDWEEDLLILHEKTPHDATSVYGKTKSLGENPDLTNIRTSIIGEEQRNKLSLLEWAKKNKGEEIDGYVNHIWNGVTCLELSNMIHDIIQNNHFWKGVRHVETPYKLSKADMLEQINDVYGLELTINRVEADIPVYRALRSVYNDGILKTTKSFRQQLTELKEFSIWV